MDLKELKAIALSNVMDPDSEYFYRFVCRWYSKTFHTPLHTVYTINSHEVLTAYFEEGYEAMEDEDKFLEMQKTVNPNYDEDEEKSIEEFMDLIEDEIAQKAVKSKSKNTKPVAPNTTAPTPNTKEPIVRTYSDEPDET